MTLTAKRHGENFNGRQELPAGNQHNPHTVAHTHKQTESESPHEAINNQESFVESNYHPLRCSSVMNLFWGFLLATAFSFITFCFVLRFHCGCVTRQLHRDTHILLTLSLSLHSLSLSVPTWLTFTSARLLPCVVESVFDSVCSVGLFICLFFPIALSSAYLFGLFVIWFSVFYHRISVDILYMHIFYANLRAQIHQLHQIPCWTMSLSIYLPFAIAFGIVACFDVVMCVAIVTAVTARLADVFTAI